MSSESVDLIVKITLLVCMVAGSFADAAEAASKGILFRGSRCPLGHRKIKVGDELYFCPVCSSKSFKGVPSKDQTPEELDKGSGI